MLFSWSRLDFSVFQKVIQPAVQYTIEPGYKDIDLYDTFSTASDTLRYQFIPVNHNIILLVRATLVYKDTKHIS